jgi:hypothetical protein
LPLRRRPLWVPAATSPNAAYCEKILAVFKKHDIRYFYYIGGNDSANTCHIINEMAQQSGYELTAYHIPKTVDNDLLVTDHCPGFGTAGRFVACALMGDDLDNRALPGVKIDIIMGRHAGFLTGTAALAKQREDDGPHLIYVPERPVTMDQFLAEVAQRPDRRGDHRLRPAQRAVGHRQGRPGRAAGPRPHRGRGGFQHGRAEQWARNYRAKAYQDYRALLDRKDVDVVIYATPEHWHYLPCIHACQAGKHMYGEQPLGHTIREGRKMIEAVRKYGRVFQTGEQQRSHPAAARPWS